MEFANFKKILNDPATFYSCSKKSRHVTSAQWLLPSMFKLHSAAAAWLCLQRWEHYTTLPGMCLLFQHIHVVTSCSPSLVSKPRQALFLISYTWFSLALLLLPDSEKRVWPIKSVFTRELFDNAAECYTQMNKTSPLTWPRRGWHHKSRRDLLS